MAHLVAGYRSLEESRDVALGLARNGADILEIQIPFSDPTADGPVITEACQHALAEGVRPRDVFDLAGEVIRETGVPVVLMSYFNLLFRWSGGLESFVEQAASCGISGLIVPDIPPEETQEPYYRICRDAGVDPVVVLSPNMPEGRLAELKPISSGFVYATARVGTTGTASDTEGEALKAFLDRVNRVFALPVAVGFGIRSRRQLEQLEGYAAVGVIGTHFLRVLQKQGKEGVIEEIRSLAAKRSVS